MAQHLSAGMPKHDSWQSVKRTAALIIQLFTNADVPLEISTHGVGKGKREFHVVTIALGLNGDNCCFDGSQTSNGSLSVR